MVAYDPLQAAAQSETSFAHEPSNVWVIRKQTRRKRGGLDDEVVVLATFFVVGDCIYMAPSVASVVGNRLVGCQIVCFYVFHHANWGDSSQLSAVTSLTSMLKTASTLPTFTPAYGHTYMPPKPVETSQTATAMQSQQSKENTPVPEADSQTKASMVGPQSSTGNVSSTVQDTRTLAESFSLLTRYEDEFMDENPLVGEPGSFILSRSGDADRNPAKQLPPSTIPSGTATNVPTRVGTPQVRVETPGKATGGTSTPVADENKLRKKKSKIGS